MADAIATRTDPAPHVLHPVTVGDRIDVLDVLRGTAIYGILLYNISGLSGYDFIEPSDARALPGARFDPTAVFALEFLVQGKFYSLFSFLFGVGYAIFLKRASARGANAIALFRRRLTGLAIIALMHTFLIWFGDILLTYAVLGLGLIPFARRDDRTVLRWAFAMLVVPIVIYMIMLGLTLAFVPATAPSDDRGFPPILAGAVRAFASGSYLDVVAGNAVFTAANILRRLALMFFPRIFGMFLLGFWAGRADIFGNVEAHLSLVRRTFACGVCVGLPLSFLGAWLGEAASRLPTWVWFLETSVESIGTPALSLGYASGIVLLFRRDSFRTVLMALSPVGRTALSNYLLQSLAGVLLFYGIGFGLFGQVSLVVLLVGATVFFVIQMAISRWWLAFAPLGPVEWLWRQFTYGMAVPRTKVSS